MRSCFSPISYKASDAGFGEQYKGSIIELLYGGISRSNRLGAIQNAFFRN